MKGREGEDKAGKFNMKEIVRITIVNSNNPLIRLFAKHV